MRGHPWVGAAAGSWEQRGYRSPYGCCVAKITISHNSDGGGSAPVAQESMAQESDDTTLITGLRRSSPGRWRRGLHRLIEPQVLFTGLTLLILSAVWTVTINIIRLERATARSAASAATLDLANTYQAQVLRAVREIDQTLKLVGYACDALDDRSADGASAALARLREQGLLPPELLFVVSVVNDQGQVIASTRPAASTARRRTGTARDAARAGHAVDR